MRHRTCKGNTATILQSVAWPAMLRITLLSREELTSLPLTELKGLKQRLHQQHGLPPRFRQRLLYEGNALDECGHLRHCRRSKSSGCDVLPTETTQTQLQPNLPSRLRPPGIEATKSSRQRLPETQGIFLNLLGFGVSGLLHFFLLSSWKP